MDHGQRPDSAKAIAYEYIKQGIISGEFKVGEFITESQIADELGMSRTPVREAVQALEQVGFLRVFPKRGAYIPPIAEHEIREVWDARQLIELHCVAYATELVDSSLCDNLKAHIAGQEEAARRHDATTFIEHDHAFHRTLVGSAGNSVLNEFYDSLRDRQLRMGIRALLSSEERFQQVLREHRRIVTTIESGNKDEANEALRDHLGRTRVAMSES